MLRLKGIKKDYTVGDTVVHALKGVDIAFRRSEFVSVLGPSGCGKTTLLNVIGGLDHYSDGELYIDGVGTKHYTDRDWDGYRNHRIGFVFQSYNLIPHQTVVENVELALSISGIDKAERTRRAREALDKVGLAGQYNKKPNQLSGGQCQRVAIARALVNDPEILLADEPTGALDTATSVQIMDLIQEISKQRLVIMVTHNAELAEKYSTRIVRLLDGELVDDTDPYDEGEEQTEQPLRLPQESVSTPKRKKIKNKGGKAKLSLRGAFLLSAKNLWSKLKRTALVCFAGSIGIIGVATVLAVSNGMQSYIESMQNDMLSGNPVSINAEALDINAIMEGRSDRVKSEAVKQAIVDGYINVDKTIEYLVKQSEDAASYRISNDITADYLAYVKAMPQEYYAAITASYGLNLSNNLYTEFVFDGETKITSLSAANNTYRALLEQAAADSETIAGFSEYFAMYTESFMQAPDSEDFILSQYEIVSDPTKSKIATESNEIMIVVDDETALSDLMLAQFGYYTQKEFSNIVYKATNDEAYDQALWKERFSYDELLNKKFVWYPNDTVFTKNSSTALPYAPAFSYNPYAGDDWEGKELMVTAILRPKEGLSYGALSSGFYYTSALTREAIASGMQSQIVAYLSETESSVFTSVVAGEIKQGLVYNFSTWTEGVETTHTGVVGSENTLGGLIGGASGSDQSVYTLTLRELGGVETPDGIKIYPTDFDYKDEVTAYLDGWNGSGDIVVGDKTLTDSERAKIVYTDNLALVIGLVNNLIEIITAALVAFTALSLVVSTVMIAIITYVSVMERVKEIGVIRSLGGRKSDVSALFVAETFIIGGVSGVIGIAVTYLISFCINSIVGKLFGIYTIASLSPTTAIIMVAISVLLTMIAGIIPANLAAKKDPVEALRSE